MYANILIVMQASIISFIFADDTKCLIAVRISTDTDKLQEGICCRPEPLYKPPIQCSFENFPYLLFAKTIIQSRHFNLHCQWQSYQITLQHKDLGVGNHFHCRFQLDGTLQIITARANQTLVLIIYTSRQKQPSCKKKVRPCSKWSV